MSSKSKAAKTKFRSLAAHGARLTGFASAMNVHHDVKGAVVISEYQGLHHNHPTRLAGKILVQGLTVHHDDALATFYKNPGN
jgi:acyl dehydratase